MEEADALTNTIAIMVNGKLKTIGTPQELKQRYGTGYRVYVRCAGTEKSREGVDNLIRGAYPASKLLGTSSSPKLRVFEIPTGGEKTKNGGGDKEEEEEGSFALGNFFGMMEEKKEACGILDYSVSQTTLDQVFSEFAKHQEVDERQG